MRMLGLPEILKYIPVTAQDLRVFFLSLRYWLSGSKENIYSLLCMLLLKYSKAKKSLKNLMISTNLLRVSGHWYLPSQDRENF